MGRRWGTTTLVSGGKRGRSRREVFRGGRGVGGKKIKRGGEAKPDARIGFWFGSGLPQREGHLQSLDRFVLPFDGKGGSNTALQQTEDSLQERHH